MPYMGLRICSDAATTLILGMGVPLVEVEGTVSRRVNFQETAVQVIHTKQVLPVTDRKAYSRAQVFPFHN